MVTTLPGERKVTIPDLNIGDVIGQGNMPAKAVVTKQRTEKVTNETLYKTGNNTKTGDIQSIIVQVAKQLMCEP